MHNTRFHIAWLFVCCLLWTPIGLGGSIGCEPMKLADDLYAESIRPLLKKHCVRCHGPGRTEGGLRLDTRQAILLGGSSGACVVPGLTNQSQLLNRIESADDSLRMPPEGDGLSSKESALFRVWIEQGCISQLDESSADLPSADSRLEHWAWQPITLPQIPIESVSAWAPNPIDAFIEAQLGAKQWKQAQEADRRVLARRLYVDLLGLLPTYEEVERFVHDQRPDAYERLVDQLLASPHYGERWAQHWLDIAHYGDTHGFERDQRRPHAWRYRDYVIRAFNDDKPYDQFLVEQIAGDALESPSPEAITATGFLAAGPWDFVGQAETPSPQIKRLARADDLDDMLTQVMTATCAVTINCARCHDHKIDPITQREYYALAAVFAGAVRGDRPIDPSPQPSVESTQAAASSVAPQVYAIQSQKPPDMHLLLRGSPEHPGDLVAPSALRCVKELNHVLAGTDASDPERRLSLAKWIVNPQNPLVRRVIVNRVWHYHFGAGFVDTPSDFGLASRPPSHPELLDWLAQWFGEQNWSIKALHRVICTSRTYRQSSAALDSPAKEMDVSNRWLWRQNVRRIDAEVLRDGVLRASGTWNDDMYGPGYEDFEYQEEYAPIYQYRFHDQPSVWRRSIYRFVVRTTPHPFLTPLDCPNPSRLTPNRTMTTTAVQSLAMWNHEFMLRQSHHMASRIEYLANEKSLSKVQLAFRLALARDPDAQEEKLATDLLAHGSLEDLCRALLNTNEFVYVD